MDQPINTGQGSLGITPQGQGASPALMADMSLAYQRGALSAVQLLRQQTESRKEQAEEPSEERSAIAANTVSAQKNEWLQGLDPIMADTIQKTGIPSTTTTSSQYGDEGQLTTSENKSFGGIDLGGTVNITHPLSQVTTLSKDPQTGESLQSTQNYLLGPNAKGEKPPPGEVAVKYDKDGNAVISPFARPVGGATQTPVSHYAPPQRNNAGEETDLAGRIDAATAQKKPDLAAALTQELNALRSGDQSKIDQARANTQKLIEQGKLVGAKGPQVTLQWLNEAQDNLQMLKDAKADPEAISRATARVKTYQDQVDADKAAQSANTTLTGAKTTETTAKGGAETAKVVQADKATQTKALQQQISDADKAISSVTKSLNAANSPKKGSDEYSDAVKQRNELQAHRDELAKRMDALQTTPTGQTTVGGSGLAKPDPSFVEWLKTNDTPENRDSFAKRFGQDELSKVFPTK